jgi:acetyl-CoA carboxylase carboxyl transferase subunit beta
MPPEAPNKGQKPMNWLSNFARPGLKKKPDEKREVQSDIWVKCPISGDLHYNDDLAKDHWVTPAGHHFRIGAQARFKTLFDGPTTEIPLPKVPQDPLKFKDDKKYTERLRAARQKTGVEDCMNAALGEIAGIKTVVLVQDFDFMGGSLGMAAGEAFIAAADRAVKEKTPMICVTAAGGARMQEGILSLMQMPRTTLAVQELKAAGLPYVVILTDPTTGGVTASYAMLGDVQIAEPGALIGFAGPRVIEQTIREKLPEGFQRAEYLKDKGMVDLVIDRREMKAKIASILSILSAHGAATISTEEEGAQAMPSAHGTRPSPPATARSRAGQSPIRGRANAAE